MNLSLEWMIAKKYLLAKANRGFVSIIALFSLLGVAFGVAALIVVMSVMNGFHIEISKKMTGFNGDIIISSPSGIIDEFDDIITSLIATKKIKTAAPLVEGQAMISFNGAASGAIVKGMRDTDLADKEIVAQHIIDGELADFSIKDSIIIGNELAKNIGAKVGDVITLLSPKGSYTAIGMIPRAKQFKVVAIFYSEMYQYDSSTIFMPLESAQILFKLPSRANSIEIMLDNKDDAMSLVDELYDVIPNKYIIQDWSTTNATYFNVLKTERTVMFVILTLIIVVAAFNIISSLIMLVKDKTTEIAILRTIGMPKESILRIFMICGLSIGVFGAILGTVLGLGFALNIENIRRFLESLTNSVIFDPVIYYLSSLPVVVELNEVANIALFAILLSLLATLYPTIKASQLNPLQGLRHE
jgi:lipoprotein-releasing system permease protein